MNGQQIVIDWDGTVTERDTLAMVLEHFVDATTLVPIQAALDAQLDAGTLSLRDVMAGEFALLTASLADVVDFVVETARLRPGFGEFAARYDPLIVSTSFHETIAPVLAREGIVARVVATHALPSIHGWTFDWVSGATCDICGEPCKRSCLPAGPFMYVGDGYSDRCASQRAERIFARAGLARFLASRSIPFDPYDDFYDVMRALA